MRIFQRLASLAGLSACCSTLLAAVVIAGCAVPVINTGQLSLSPGSPLVARKIQRPLVIVLDPQLVPDEFVMSSMKKQVEIREIREFVRRDLRGSMLSFFENVEVVAPDTSIDPNAHVGHVRIDRFDGQGTFPQTAGPGMNSQVYGRMTWSFALLPSRGRDYLFSYADTTTGDFPLVRTADVSSMIESTFVRAIEMMMHRFIEDGAYQAFLTLDAAPPDTPHPTPREEGSSTSNESGQTVAPDSAATNLNAQEAPPSGDE